MRCKYARSAAALDDLPCSNAIDLGMRLVHVQDGTLSEQRCKRFMLSLPGKLEFLPAGSYLDPAADSADWVRK